MIEIKISLQPKQKAFRESIERFPVTLYGGAKGGGKSRGMRDIFLLRRFEYPGSHGAIFRRTYPELEANHIRPLLENYPALRDYWHDSKKLLTLPNGSTLQFCHCKNELDVDLYQGREFHDLGIEEAGQWSEPMFRKLHGSNRSSKAGIPARTALTANPGGVGHTWLKRLFIEKRYEERERPGDYHFIPALVDDNPALLENDPEYVYRLEAEPNEALRRAYRYGDWDIFAGQFFGEISRDVHLIDPFPIPDHYSREGAYDYGFNHPAVFGWFAGDGDGNVYMYRELAKAKLRVDQFAQELLKYEDTKRLQKIPAGRDCWTQKSTLRDDKKPPTVAEEFAAHGIFLTPATVDRIQGANQVRKYLAWRDKPSKKPRLFIFKTCPITFDCLTRMQTDPGNLEDVLKVDASDGDPMTGDDPYDMLRYYLMSRPILAEAPPPPKPGTAEWQQAEAEKMRQWAFEAITRQQEEERDPLQEFEKYY